MNDLFLDEVVQPERPEQPQVRDRSGRRAERDRKRKQRRRRSTAALVISLLLLGGAAYVVWQYVVPVLTSFTDREPSGVTDYPGPGHSSAQVEIPSGASGQAMGIVLEEAGVVASARAFTNAFAANPSAAGIQPGTYSLLLEMSAADAVVALLNPENRVQTRVTIPEGLRVEQIVERLASVTALPAEDFEAAMADPAAVGLPAEAGGSYEGWLFGSTYAFEPGTTATDIITRMIAQTVSILDERAVPPEARQELLIKASLVERESPNAEASAKMARAIQNRLDRDMRLEIDASIAYGLNKPGTELTTEDLRTADTPYNLHQRTGLPPTPIASPSAASIDAVLNPEDGDWIFWATINLDTGETRFSATYDEHRENVALLRQWQAENPG
ncbi:endolytic transglycosylase MltG [Actinotalea sp. K2]|uniref:endolytic transglycosylase MltG n=1 Tax=Actinotalea sp. K2 TaxID=2939438 RepID=UPI002017828D|nr:endolytic transglycosylase MltG [Actinotalea sp. K2]MCL3862854.1 endolytic transglycosylase MltG [Actinotalea sp. K2]